jgi:hypothetical protein
MTFFGANDAEIAPINRHLFARKLGQVIARARTNVKRGLVAPKKQSGSLVTNDLNERRGHAVCSPG